MAPAAARPSSAPPTLAPASQPPPHPPPSSRPASAPPPPASTVAAAPELPPACVRAPASAAARTSPLWDEPFYILDADEPPPTAATAWARADGRAGRADAAATPMTPAFPAVFGPKMVTVTGTLLPIDAIVAGALVAVAVAARAIKRSARLSLPAHTPTARTPAESEAAARALKARFRGALDGGDGVGAIERDDGDESAADPSRREWRKFEKAVRLHLVDEDAWVT